MAEYGIKLDSLESAIVDIQRGNLVVLLDNPSREGEGDFVGPAALITPDQVNTMLTYARGAFVTVLMPEYCAERFQLPPQVDHSNNAESRKTNFRLTCDTRYGKSGCSALERAQTVNILGGRLNPSSDPIFRYLSASDKTGIERISEPGDLVRPGHVVPIVANPNGLYARQGHTEGAVELMKLADINHPAAIDMEILHPDGSMAKADYIRQLADRLQVKVISIGQICNRLGIPEKTD